MEPHHQGSESEFERELSNLKKEIELEKHRLDHIKEEEVLEEEQLEHLEKEVDRLEREHHHHEKALKLIFIVNTQPVEIEARLDWKLEKAVELALDKSGNKGRPISDWTVKRGNTTLDLVTPIGDFHFRECEELFVSLNAGQGGTFNHKSRLCR